MLTAPTGESRPHPTQLRLPAFPIPPDTHFQYPDSDLNYSHTPNGVLVTYEGLLVAWLYHGHAGSRNNPNRCQFWDCAYPSLTTGQQNRITGIMLDSHSFDSLAEAVQFIEHTFADGEATQ